MSSHILSLVLAPTSFHFFPSKLVFNLVITPISEANILALTPIVAHSDKGIDTGNFPILLSFIALAVAKTRDGPLVFLLVPVVEEKQN